MTVRKLPTKYLLSSQSDTTTCALFTFLQRKRTQCGYGDEYNTALLAMLYCKAEFGFRCSSNVSSNTCGTVDSQAACPAACVRAASSTDTEDMVITVTLCLFVQSTTDILYQRLYLLQIYHSRA